MVASIISVGTLFIMYIILSWRVLNDIIWGLIDSTVAVRDINKRDISIMDRLYEIDRFWLGITDTK